MFSASNIAKRYLQKQAGDKKTDYRDSVGLFIPLPADLASQFPPLGDEDRSPPHTTFLFVGTVTEEQEPKFLKTLEEAFQGEGWPKVRAKLDHLDYFQHSDKGRVVPHVAVTFSHAMAELRDRIKSRLESAGFKVEDSFPTYRPHVTLAYTPGFEESYKGDVPTGSWDFNQIEVWGLPKVHTIQFSPTEKQAGLQEDFVRRMDKLVRSFSWEEARPLGKWMAQEFRRVELPRTPRGTKKLKDKLSALIWYLKNGNSEGYAQSISSAWGELRPHADTLIRHFSEEGAVSIPAEIKIGQTVYRNLVGWDEAKLKVFASKLEDLWKSVKGWRAKAFKGGLKVALAGPKHFRGTSSGVYKSGEDTLYIRATPKVLARTGAYGSPPYILIHELGHRYEWKNRLPVDFERPEWTTSRYSSKEGEKFAELFALGHFGLTGNWDPARISRFEDVMMGRAETVARVAGQYLARARPFDLKDIEKLRKDFLMLMKNVKVVRDYAQAERWKEAVRQWNEHFESVVLNSLRRDIKNLQYQDRYGISKQDAEYWERKIGSDVWDLHLAFRVPLTSYAYAVKYEPSVTKEGLFERMKRDLSKWEGQVRRASRKAWRVLKDFAEWYEARTSEKMVVDIPAVDQENIEGFKVRIKGYDPESSHSPEAFGRFRAGLKRYKQRAKQVLPLLLQRQLPLVLDYTCSLGLGGRYERTYIQVCPHASDKNPGHMAKILAHEMGHHLWRSHLSREASDLWGKFISGNYGSLDLRDVLRKFPNEKWIFDNERIRREDPILYLQIHGLFHDPSVKGIFENILSTDDLRKYLDGGGEAVFRVHGKPISGYAHKNPEEAFCEALGMLVGYGPRTVLPEVRSWLKTILPQIKVAECLMEEVPERRLEDLVALRAKQQDSWLELTPDVLYRAEEEDDEDKDEADASFLKIAPPVARVAYRHRLRTAGWWAIQPGSPGINPPPVDKGGFMNAIPGIDPECARYNGDGPADTMGDAFEAINKEYLETWGRPAEAEEMQAVFDFVFGAYERVPEDYMPKAARAIPIDRPGIRRFSVRLERALADAFFKAAQGPKRDKWISWKEVWAIEPFTVKNVVGEDVPTKVIVISSKDRKPGPYVKGAGVGTWRGSQVVLIQLNGSYTAEEYQKAAESRILAPYIDSMLVHEFTHIADKFKKEDYETGKARGPYEVSDLRAYYNAPAEVRAYMQQVVDEVLNFGGSPQNAAKLVSRFGQQRGVSMLLKNSETWREIEKHLVPRNRNLIMKSVYQALVSAGAVTASSVASLHMAASAHKRSVALMKFLSDAARRLGVAQHVYVVGGAVRNFVIDRPIKDLDLVIDSIQAGRDSAWFAKEVARQIPAPTDLTTNRYGVAILTVKGDWELGGEDMRGEVIEIANARSESYGKGLGDDGKGYKPTKVEPATIEEDLRRRDFTVNTLMWRLLDLATGPEKAEIIDLMGCGKRDLEQRVLRCPQDPDRTFSDDPTRMLRLVRFVSKYNMKVPPDVAAAVRRNAHKLKNAPWEAVASILMQTLKGR